MPRNWAQQVGPYLDLLERRVKGREQGFRPFAYGVRICPDPVQWGHLSGCTYSEGVSWGKFLPRDRGGRWVEVLADATIAWPLILQAVLERLDARKRPPPGPDRARRTRKQAGGAAGTSDAARAAVPVSRRRTPARRSPARAPDARPGAAASGGARPASA